MKETRNTFWTGRPASGLRHRAVDRYWVPRGALVVLVVASGWWIEFRHFPWGAQLAFGVPLAFVVSQIVLTRFFVDAWLRSRCSYQVRREGLLILVKGRVCDRIPIERLALVDVIEEGALASIVFGDHEAMRMFPGLVWPAGRMRPWAFELLSHADTALEAIQAARRANDLPKLSVRYGNDWHSRDPTPSANPFKGAAETFRRGRSPRADVAVLQPPDTEPAVDQDNDEAVSETQRSPD